MSENNYGALMLKSALDTSVDLTIITVPGIYPVTSGNSSAPDSSAGLLVVSLTPSGSRTIFLKESSSVLYSLVSGKWIKPTASDVNAVAKIGDTMTGGLTLVESDIVLKTSSSDSPQYTIINTTTGASVSMDLIDRRFRIFGVPWGGGPVKQFTFNLETGEFSIPQANIKFGSGIIQADANIYGTAWGENGNSGWINIWITNRINEAKTWVNQNFITGVKRGAQSSMVMDGGLVEAPSGCVLTGGNGNESNQVGIALYRPLQVWRNGGWVTIGD